MINDKFSKNLNIFWSLLYIFDGTNLSRTYTYIINIKIIAYQIKENWYKFKDFNII